MSLLLALSFAAPEPAPAQASRSGAAAQQLGKTSAKKKPPAKKKTSRKTRKKRAPARTRAAAVLPLDSCAAETLTAVQDSLRRHIEQWLDVRYKRGGITMKGVDCSGFLMEVYRAAAGLRLPRTSREQAAAGHRITEEELAFGDLVFFRTRLKSKRISHVGIYIGGDRFVHAGRQRGVSVDRLSSSYFSRRFVMARRVLFPGGEKSALTDSAGPAPATGGP